MKPRLSLQIPYSPPGTDTVSSPTYTPLSERRRSLLSIAGSLHSLSSLNSLKPSKNKLQKCWPGSRSPTSRGTFKDWNVPNDLSAVVQRVCSDAETADGTQVQRPRVKDDPSVRNYLEQSLPRSVTRSSKQIHRKPLPPSVRPFPGLPAPQRAPPPPPIPELSAVNYHHDDYAPFELHELSAANDTDPSPFRRRPKTPVHRIGQLEMAAMTAGGNLNGINRMSSVSTIAREYRGLVDYPEVPEIDPRYRDRGYESAPSSQIDASFGHIKPSPVITIPQLPTHQAPLSSSVSDDGTLLGSEPDTTHPKHLSTSSDTAAKEIRGISDEEEETAPSSLRFQIGLQLLTKELSAALASHCQTGDRSAAGLQVWVMIEAYEKLRTQLAATSAQENQDAMFAIDSWLKALYSIHSEIAFDGAAGDSDYESG